MMLGKWRQRYLDKGVTGLHDELRPGRSRSSNDEEVANVINLVLQTKPDDSSTHWSTRTVAAKTGISKSTVQRWLQTFSIQPRLLLARRRLPSSFWLMELRKLWTTGHQWKLSRAPTGSSALSQVSLRGCPEYP